jgi:hypothetical protein
MTEGAIGALFKIKKEEKPPQFVTTCGGTCLTFNPNTKTSVK